MIGEMRSHFDTTPFTATCTIDIKHRILEIFHLKPEDVVTTAVVPDRPNIHLKLVTVHPTELEETLDWYLKMLASSELTCNKAVIYCRNLRQTGRGYGMLS